MADHIAAAEEHSSAASETQQEQQRHRSRYVPALDGLRSFAVLAVIFYHMRLGWAPGGLMGVTVFFVISGYLINGLLVAEREDTGRIDIVAFWLRRIRRLFPAIFLTVVATATLCTLFDHTLLDKMRPDIVPSLLFYNNWWQVFRDISYFEAAGSPSPLTHFWSLSIEEQFYVVWPLLLIGMYALGFKKKTIARVALVLAALSCVEMAVLYDPAGDPSRIYYGTDTRAMSLLLGVWLAVAWPSAAFGGEPSMSGRSESTWIGFNIAGVVALVALAAIIGFTTGYSAFPYYGGIALVTVLSAVVIAVLVVPGTWLAKLFSLKPLVFIGKLSYGMYLWHFPILLLTTDANTTSAVPWWMRIVQLALIIGAAWLSFTFVEDPIRKGKLTEWLNAQREGLPLFKTGMRMAVPAGIFAGLLTIAVIGITVVPPTDYASQLAGSGKTSSGTPPAALAAQSGEASGGESGESQPDGASGESQSPLLATITVPEIATYESTFQQPHVNDAGQPVYAPLLIGDSVSLGAEEAFYARYPYGCLDSVVSRNIWESPYSNYLDAGQAGEYVVFCLGTNNAVEDWQIDDLLWPVKEGSKVLLVNTRNTQDWFEQTNAAIANAPARYPDVTVIDWYGASEGHDEWFAGDGTHLTDEGAAAYISLIDNALRASFETQAQK